MASMNRLPCPLLFGCVQPMGSSGTDQREVGGCGQGICFPGSPDPRLHLLWRPQLSPGSLPHSAPSLSVLVTMSSSCFTTRTIPGVLLFLALGILLWALWFPYPTHIFVNTIPFIRFSICPIFVCHLLLAGLEAPQVSHLSNPSLISLSAGLLFCSPAGLLSFLHTPLTRLIHCPLCLGYPSLRSLLSWTSFTLVSAAQKGLL